MEVPEPWRWCFARVGAPVKLHGLPCCGGIGPPKTPTPNRWRLEDLTGPPISLRITQELPRTVNQVIKLQAGPAKPGVESDRPW